MTHKINHVAIVVKDIDVSKQLFAIIGNSVASETSVVADQQVKVCFIETGETKIELIQPLAGNVGVTKFLEKRGEGLHHICIAVEDIDASLADFKARGFRLIDELPRRGAEGHRVAFIHPQSTNGVLIELEELPAYP